MYTHILLACQAILVNDSLFRPQYGDTPFHTAARYIFNFTILLFILVIIIQIITIIIMFTSIMIIMIILMMMMTTGMATLEWSESWQAPNAKSPSRIRCYNVMTLIMIWWLRWWSEYWGKGYLATFSRLCTKLRTNYGKIVISQIFSSALPTLLSSFTSTKSKQDEKCHQSCFSSKIPQLCFVHAAALKAFN